MRRQKTPEFLVRKLQSRKVILSTLTLCGSIFVSGGRINYVWPRANSLGGKSQVYLFLKCLNYKHFDWRFVYFNCKMVMSTLIKSVVIPNEVEMVICSGVHRAPSMKILHNMPNLWDGTCARKVNCSVGSRKGFLCLLYKSNCISLHAALLIVVFRSDWIFTSIDRIEYTVSR